MSSRFLATITKTVVVNAYIEAETSAEARAILNDNLTSFVENGEVREEVVEVRRVFRFPTYKRLGKSQQVLLNILSERRRQEWFAGCGWVLGTFSQTDKLFQSLLKRGMVERIGSVAGYGNYRITDEGRANANPNKKEVA